MNYKIEFEDGEYGPRAILKESWRPEFRDILLERGVEELFLNQSSGFLPGSSDFEFLTAFPGLKYLLIFAYGIKTLAPIHELHELRCLRLITYGNHGIDFNAFPLLRKCEFQWMSRSGSLFKHVGLEKLTLDNCPRKDSRLLAGMTAMRSLSLNCVRFADLSGLRPMSMLNYLWIKNCAALKSLDGIEDLESLETISLLYLNTIPGIDRIKRLRNLKRLTLISIENVASLAFLEDFKELEEINFMGKTNVRDGDLSFLSRLPNLKRVAYNHRPHYNVDPADLGERFKGNA